MNRDENTEQEAKDRIKEVQDLIEECNYDPEESEDLLMDMLGLEPDYIVDLLL
jgi:hypothetical protein